MPLRVRGQLQVSFLRVPFPLFIETGSLTGLLFADSEVGWSLAPRDSPVSSLPVMVFQVHEGFRDQTQTLKLMQQALY